MAYLRLAEEMLTCFQERADYDPRFAPMADLALVYGLDDSLPERLSAYQAAGYRCAVMFGIAWGDYQDYLSGAFDGTAHFDEGQRDRDGKELIHGPTVPYLVPTRSFCEYIAARLSKAVDAGAEGIVIEEPELSAFGGYSEAFRREYERRYRDTFVPQHESVEAAAKCAQLKSDLYAEAIQTVSAKIKAYAAAQGKQVFVTVATHSAVNYSQWQIVSPVGRVGLMPEVDALIGQVWTGTARTAQVYGGKVGERIFETALLEYASLTAAAGSKPIWLLCDPIEDSPAHTWEMYEKSYIDTLTACLMQPGVRRYELIPWPRRVFLGKYPLVQPNIANKDERSYAHRSARPIPADYASVLCGAFELLGNMPDEPGTFDGAGAGVCVLLSDSCLYERRVPDTVPCDREFEQRGFALLSALRSESPTATQECSHLLSEGLKENDPARLSAFKESTLSPDLFGLTLPLVKRGLPVGFVFTSHLAQAGRMPENTGAAVLSYDFMKPESPAVHEALCAWLRAGGALIYIGSEENVFAKNADAWWTQLGYAAPEEHLFDLCGLSRSLNEGSYAVGSGCLTRVCASPARICLSPELAGHLCDCVAAVLAKQGPAPIWRNHFLFRRGKYVICAVMDENDDARPAKLPGAYADLRSPSFEIRKDVTLFPGERAILYDLNQDNRFMDIIGTQVRILSMEKESGRCRLVLRGQKGIEAHLRLYAPAPPTSVCMRTMCGEDVPAACDWDSASNTLLVSWSSAGEKLSLLLEFDKK
ncbi:MAG: hypothetical protein IJM56_05195 [Clostridia bacterium]|nr:hypothetical protein [Clostridia bacterium]